MSYSGCLALVWSESLPHTLQKKTQDALLLKCKIISSHMKEGEWKNFYHRSIQL